MALVVFTSSLLYMAACSKEFKPSSENNRMISNKFEPNNFQDLNTQISLLEKSTFKIDRNFNLDKFNVIEILNSNWSTREKWTSIQIFPGDPEGINVKSQCTFYENGLYNCPSGLKIKISDEISITLTMNSYTVNSYTKSSETLRLRTIQPDVRNMQRIALTRIGIDYILSYRLHTPAGLMKLANHLDLNGGLYNEDDAHIDRDEFLGLSQNAFDIKKKELVKMWSFFLKYYAKRPLKYLQLEKGL